MSIGTMVPYIVGGVVWWAAQPEYRALYTGLSIEEAGAITVPARLLTDFVNSLPSEKIEMTLAPRSRQL